MPERIIGFIGLGVMGKSMARRLLKAGYPLFVYTRTKEKASDLLQEGAVWKDSPKEVAEAADIVITMVGYPEDVRAVYLGGEGLIPNGRAGQFFIDMTTSSPALAQRLFAEGKKRGIHLLDAPVSGGDIGAKNGTLAIMVGGEEEAFREMLPVFETLGKRIEHMGGAGSGQHAKLANQIAIASNMVGLCETLVYAKHAGLPMEKALSVISAGAAGSWSLANLAPRILAGDYSPGFFIKHFIKDMKIALEEAEKMGLALPGLALAKRLYGALAERGEENSGTQALIKYWDGSGRE